MVRNARDPKEGSSPAASAGESTQCHVSPGSAVQPGRRRIEQRYADLHARQSTACAVIVAAKG